MKPSQDVRPRRISLLAALALLVSTIVVVSSPPEAAEAQATNVAIGKAASQSSLCHGGVASRVVDGNTNGVWGNGSVAHTCNEAQPWIDIDLGQAYQVDTIKLWNRTDCCADRTSNYSIFVSPTPMSGRSYADLSADAAVWGEFRAAAPNPSATFSAGGFSGRYVRLQLSGTNFINVAELEVFAAGGGGGGGQANLSQSIIRTDGVEGGVTSQSNALVDAQVWDIEFVGNRAFVAGKFERVVRATTDWARVDQPFLAAFDMSTGSWDPSFRPQLDGPAWALDEGPDGQLYVGGEFSTVNGVSRPGLVAFDTATGDVDSEFDGWVERRWSDSLAVIRDLHRHGDDLYVIGSFSHATDGSTTMQAGKVARFDAATGEPDRAWVPVLSGRSGWAIDTSDDGQRVFLGGQFSYVNGANDTDLFAAVDAATGALIPGFDNGFNAPRRAVWPTGGIVYDLSVAGDRVYLAGAEHFWEARSAANGQSLQLTLSYNGNWFNDTQVAELELGKMWIGCHCYRHWGYSNHDIVSATGQITGTLTRGVQAGDGVWAVDAAPDGCLWMGGDLRGTRNLHGYPDNGSFRWVGRFARFCPEGGPPQPPPPPPGGNEELLAAGSNWKVLAATEWPQRWTENGFDAGSWINATAEFGYGDGNEATVISNATRPAAVLGRATFTVDDPDAFEQLMFEVQADDGATVWINGNPVVAQNIADGTIDASTLATRSVWGSDERAWTEYRVDADHLIAGTNVVAVSVHQGWSGSSDLGFDLRIEGLADAAGADDPEPNISIATPQPDAVVLRAYGDASRYLEDAAGAPDGWTAPGFTDGSWNPGTGSLGFGEDNIDTVMNHGLTTYYIRASFDIPAGEVGQPMVVEMQRDDGVVVYLNGSEIGRDTMPDGPIDSSTRASAFIYGAAESETISFTVPAGLAQAGGNVLAIEVHQADPNSADLQARFRVRTAP